MVNEVAVISSDLDGAQLRREQSKGKYFIRCDGKEDNEQIQDAIDHLGKCQFSVPAEGWEAIFGSDK